MNRYFIQRQPKENLYSVFDYDNGPDDFPWHLYLEDWEEYLKEGKVYYVLNNLNGEKVVYEEKTEALAVVKIIKALNKRKSF